MQKEQTRKYNSFYQIITTVNTTPEQKYELLESFVDAIIKEDISQEREKWAGEIIEIIKTPMSTKFEDVEEESADYSIENFRARLLNKIKDIHNKKLIRIN